MTVDEAPVERLRRRRAELMAWKEEHQEIDRILSRLAASGDREIQQAARALRELRRRHLDHADALLAILMRDLEELDGPR